MSARDVVVSAWKLEVPATRTVALCATLLLFGCGVGTTVTETPSTTRPTGGTLRALLPVEQGPSSLFTEPEGNAAALDPHLDVFSPYDSWELLRCCLGRTLLSNNGRSTSDGGVRIHPDVAESMPEISADGLTWTFKLKQGLRYAPPLEADEITAADFVRSFHRLLAPRFAETSFAAYLYLDIVGAEDYRNGEAASITGLETPDRYTIVIRLTRAAGDFAPRLALPVTLPIPPSPGEQSAAFGVAEGHDDGYGRFLVSSGPYMIEGSPDLDFSVPPAQRTPVAGLVPGQRISLVENPSWDPASDELRIAASPRIELEVVPTLAEAAQRVYDAEADLLLNFRGSPQIPANIVDTVRSDVSLGSIHINESDAIGGIMMNVAMPPFDDLFVRKAAAFALNKARLIELAGGPLQLRVAHHMVPDAMEDNLLVDYRPYPSPGDAGDVAAAREMMRQSRYDTNGDGSCDAAACLGVRALARDFAEFPDVAESVRADLAQIGVMLEPDLVPIDEFFTRFEDPTQKYAMYVPLAWSKDALSPSNFFVGQFYGPVSLTNDRGNGSLVGASSERLSQWGYGGTETPNVDARIEACMPLTGAAQFECWAGLDQHMMENVLPSITVGSSVGVIHASRRVLDYEWDQLAAAPSFDRIRVAP